MHFIYRQHPYHVSIVVHHGGMQPEPSKLGLFKGIIRPHNFSESGNTWAGRPILRFCSGSQVCMGGKNRLMPEKS